MVNVIHILTAIDDGGAERVVYNYYEHLDRSKIRFTVVAIDKGRKQLLEDGFREMGAEIRYVPQRVFDRLMAINRILKEGRYDVIHCHVFFLAEIYMLLGRFYHVPIRIAHAHMAYVTGHLKKRLLKRLFRPILKIMTTKRFACGEAAGKYVWGNLNGVMILNNAIDLKKFAFNSAVRDEYRKKIGVKDDDIVIGHVGRFNEQKNHKFLVLLFEQLCKKNPERSYYLVMIGVGEELETIKKQTDSSKYKERYLYLGSQLDVYNWMQTFDEFVLPSLFEGLPLVGIEAQTAGLPCIFSSAITSEFRMGKHVKFLSLKSSIDEWVKCVYEYGELKTRDDNTELITASGFDIDTEAKKLEQIYGENMRG